MELQRRYCEFRFADGQPDIITGTAMRYGDTAIAEGKRERFVAGSVKLFRVVEANIQHARDQLVAVYPDGGLSFRDTPEALEVALELGDSMWAVSAKEMIADKLLRGFSVEYWPLRSRMIGGVHVIERCLVQGVALCAAPAYEQATLDRQRDNSREIMPSWW